jgi:hypothetical protein
MSRRLYLFYGTGNENCQLGAEFFFCTSGNSISCSDSGVF